MDFFVFVVIDLVMAVLAGVLAQAKGRFGFGYFLLALFLPLIGLIFAGLMPTKVQLATSGGGRGDLKKCRACDEIMPWEARACRRCGRPV